jgi:ATP:guanido phosphotransferase, N-terminal domain
MHCALLLLLTMQAGIDAPHLGVGIVAGDEESYEAFKDIMDKVIEVASLLVL